MSKDKNKRIPTFIYGLAVIAAVVGALIFKPADNASVTNETETVITSSVTESITAAASNDETSVQDITETLPQMQESESSTEAEPVQTTQETGDSVTVTDYYFRNQSVLESHYKKHGIEMGFSSPEEYEAAASDVINSPDALYKLEKEDGDGVYYIEETNEFAVLSTDGYIRTYFLPSAGKAYFDRQ